ncbi:site-2 protease family protein [Virgibacillus xinjiangensis]|uniref:Site-2 protease family protein n=1 Tax=Virgibacillus xinjiangensis TaxID=393090 RepID=A0ABV7CRE1_9BACI
MSIVIHELGHAVAARILEAEETELSIGIGKKIGSLKAAGIQVNFHICYFLGGLAQSRRREPFTDREKVWVSFAGPLASATISLLAGLYLPVTDSNEYLRLFFLFNLWLAAINIIPFKVRGKETDGYIILTIIKKCRSLSKYKHR